MMRSTLRRSLGWRVVASVLFGELAFGLVLAVTIGTFAALMLAEQQQAGAQRLTNVTAAAVMPLVADGQDERVAATLRSIVEAADLQDIECIRVIDSSGTTLAAYGDADACAIGILEPTADPWTVLFESRLVRKAIEVNGLEVAAVYVGLAPPRVAEVLTVPLAVSGIVLLSVMLVSVPWTLWVVVKDFAEPLQELEDYAARIAEGDYAATLDRSARGEIGELQAALSAMAVQLAEQRTRLLGSYAELSEAYESVESAKRDIEELAAVKTDFVAVAAHEIRAPLSAIRLFAEMLKTGEIGELEPAVEEAVTAIYAAASRLGSITSDLMDSALLERGTLPMQIDTVWLDEVIEEGVRDARVPGRMLGITVRVEGELPEMVVNADALRIRQVLDNLLSNAMKYSPEGSEILVSAVEEEHWVAFEVADQGRGVADEARNRLFTLFGRVDFGDSREAAGLGLGLAISARIVEAHGGVISFRANDGGAGAVFTVRLPKAGPLTDDSGRVVVSVVDRGSLREARDGA